MKHDHSSNAFQSWPNFVRVIAIVLVVSLHVAAQIIYLGEPVGSHNWIVAMVYNGVSRICVPLFFMVSGYLLLNKRETLKTFYSKRAKRIVIPLIIWSLIYTALIHLVEAQHPSETSSMNDQYLQQVVGAGWMILVFLFIHPVYYHLWFLHALLFQYIFLPLWRQLLKSFHEVGVIAVLGIWFFYVSAGFLFPSLKEVLPYNIGLYTFGFTGYLFAGWKLGTLELRSSWYALAWIIFFLSTLLTLIVTYCLSVAKGELDLSFQIDSPNIILSTLAAFYIIRYMAERFPPSLIRFINKLSDASFGIYLIHPLLLYILSASVFKLRITADTLPPIIMIPVLTGFTILVSFWCVTETNKIKIMRPVFGNSIHS